MTNTSDIELVARAIVRGSITGPKDHLDEQENLHWHKYECSAVYAISALENTGWSRTKQSEWPSEDEAVEVMASAYLGKHHMDKNSSAYRQSVSESKRVATKLYRALISSLPQPPEG